MQQSLDRLFDIFHPIVARLGLVLIDVEWLPMKGRASLAVLIARPGGSVGIVDCENVTRALDMELENSLTEVESYVLEVSSPGLERVLKRPHEYDVFHGRIMNVVLSVPYREKMEYRGELRGRVGDSVQLQLSEGELLALPITLIKKAKLVFIMK